MLTSLYNGIIKKFFLWTRLIPLVLICISLFISKSCFMLTVAWFLPSILGNVICMRDESHSYIIITIFNLIAVLPYMKNLFSSFDITYAAKIILGNLNMWFIIYSISVFGKILHIIVPLSFAHIGIYHAKLSIKKLVRSRQKIAQEWNIEI